MASDKFSKLHAVLDKYYDGLTDAMVDWEVETRQVHPDGARLMHIAASYVAEYVANNDEKMLADVETSLQDAIYAYWFQLYARKLNRATDAFNKLIPQFEHMLPVDVDRAKCFDDKLQDMKKVEKTWESLPWDDKIEKYKNAVIELEDIRETLDDCWLDSRRFKDPIGKGHADDK